MTATWAAKTPCNAHPAMKIRSPISPGTPQKQTVALESANAKQVECFSISLKFDARIRVTLLAELSLNKEIYCALPRHPEEPLLASTLLGNILDVIALITVRTLSSWGAPKCCDQPDAPILPRHRGVSMCGGQAQALLAGLKPGLRHNDPRSDWQSSTREIRDQFRCLHVLYGAASLGLEPSPVVVKLRSFVCGGLTCRKLEVGNPTRSLFVGFVL